MYKTEEKRLFSSFPAFPANRPGQTVFQEFQECLKRQRINFPSCWQYNHRAVTEFWYWFNVYRFFWSGYPCFLSSPNLPCIFFGKIDKGNQFWFFSLLMSLRWITVEFPLPAFRFQAEMTSHEITDPALYWSESDSTPKKVHAPHTPAKKKRKKLSWAYPPRLIFCW